MVRASTTLSWVLMWSIWLFDVHANLPLPLPSECPLHTTSGHLSHALLPPQEAPWEVLSAHRTSIQTWQEQRSNHGWSHSEGSLREVYRTYWVLCPPTLLRTFIPAFFLDNAYRFEKPSPLFHHMDDLKAVLLNYFLINWLSCCQARSLKADSFTVWLAYYSGQLWQIVNIYKDNVEKARVQRGTIPDPGSTFALAYKEANAGIDLHTETSRETFVTPVSPKFVMLCT